MNRGTHISDDDPSLDTLHGRLLSVRALELADLSYGRIGEPIGMNHETVRRMFNGGTPTAALIAGLTSKFGISAHWLLLREGPRRCDEFARWAMRQADASDLLHALADKWVDVSDRLIQASRYLSMAEAKSRPEVEVPARRRTREARR